jgi:hypothetical protein
MGNSYRDELGWAYHGEVYGEAMFSTMADAVDDPERAAQLGLMALLERQTKEQLAALCDREGIVRNDTDAVANGTAVGERARRPTWDHERFLRSFSPITEEALPRYRVMREVAPAGDGAVMDALIAHEEALQAAADRLLAGDSGGDAIAPLLAVLVEPHRDAAEALARSVPGQG